MITLKISKDFTDTPGTRYRSDGPYSGEQFLEELLLPRFEEALSKDQKLLVDLDGAYGYAASFLEESFGGLTRKYNEKIVRITIELKSEDQQSLLDKIYIYIADAQ